uniref:Uncharacterized protein n=1 Tax=Micrurus lemniscatus lemniscatus TaxID=129467 RepID=A0A2D4JB73_MICLE
MGSSVHHNIRNVRGDGCCVPTRYGELRRLEAAKVALPTPSQTPSPESCQHLYHAVESSVWRAERLTSEGALNMMGEREEKEGRNLWLHQESGPDGVGFRKA